jgi:hypothetical protein
VALLPRWKSKPGSFMVSRGRVPYVLEDRLKVKEPASGHGGDHRRARIGSLGVPLMVRSLRTDHRSVGWVPCDGTCPSEFKSLTWHGCSHFYGFILGFNGAMLSVVGDVLVDSESHVVTS